MNIFTHFRLLSLPPSAPLNNNNKNWFANYELSMSISPRRIHVKWLSNNLKKNIQVLIYQIVMLTKSVLLRGRTAVLLKFCLSWHNLVGIKITVRLHLLNRLFKCIQNSMHALLVHWVFFIHSQRSCDVYCSSFFFFSKRHQNYFHVKFVVNCLRVTLCFQGVRPCLTENGTSLW